MHRSGCASILFACALLAGASFAGGDAGPPSLPPASPAHAPRPKVALLATRPGALHSTLHLAELGAAAPSAAVATFEHLEHAAVRGAVLPGGAVVLAIADTRAGRDASFAASLIRLQPRAAPQLLCERVVHASRPLVTPTGRVFVSRGIAGAQPSPGQYRVDELTVDEVDPATGSATTVYTTTGQLAHLAGSSGSELLLYRVAPEGAQLIAVDVVSLQVRSLGELTPYARDFSVDPAGALVLQNRHESDPHRWVVDRIDLATGARARLHESSSMNLAPFAWPDGTVVLNPDGARGLVRIGAAGLLAKAGPLGPGVDWARAASGDDAWVALSHTVPGALPVPFALPRSGAEPLPIPAPPGARVEIAGFVGAEVTP